jgi:hypothetical protein
MLNDSQAVSDGFGQDSPMHPSWKRIDAELTARGRSITWLAQRMESSVQRVYNWQSRGIPASAYPELAEALGKSIDWVAGKDEDEPSGASGLSPMAMKLAVEFDRIKDDAAQLAAFAHIIGVIARASGSASAPPPRQPDPESTETPLRRS